MNLERHATCNSYYKLFPTDETRKIPIQSVLDQRYDVKWILSSKWLNIALWGFERQIEHHDARLNLLQHLY